MAKELKAFFCRIMKHDNLGEKHIKKNEIEQLISIIKQLELSKSSETTENSRYKTFNKNNSYFLKLSSDFSPEEDSSDFIPVEESDNYIYGIFAKDRSVNYPSESDNSCKLSKIKFQNEKSKLSEVTFFIIYKPLSVIMWVNRKSVGTVNKFTEYINTCIRKQLPYKINILPIANSKNEHILNNCSVVKNLDFKFIDHPDNLSEIKGSTEEKSKLFLNEIENELIKSYEVKITFEETQTKENPKKIIAFIQNIFNKNPKKLQANVVFEGENIPIDMFKSDLFINCDIEQDKQYPDTEKLFKKLKKQLDNKLNELKIALIEK